MFVFFCLELLGGYFMDNKKCELYDRDCIDCGECDICDLDPKKKCDSCGKCLETDNDYKAIKITKIITKDNKS